MNSLIINGDARHIPLADNSVQCVVTSPPYYGLRNYQVAGQIGLEQSPAEYVAQMVQVFNEVRRVLRDDGVCWLNLGDSYGSAGGDTYTGFNERYSGTGGSGSKQDATLNGVKDRDISTGLKPKNLLGIPWRVAFALQDAGWYLRSDIIWSKPNPMPESVTDRPTKAHEYVFLLTKSARYFYDADAVKEAATTKEGRPSGVVRDRVYNYDSKQAAMGLSRGGEETAEPTTRNLRSVWKIDNTLNEFLAYCASRGVDVDALAKDFVDGQRDLKDTWNIATQPYSGAHFAAMPPELARRCIKAGSKAGDLILDPFNGSGTTGKVALELGRRYVGIELNREYIELSQERQTVTLGMGW